MRLEEAGGKSTRQPDSRWVVSYWYIPGSCDYTNAKALAGFFSDAQHEAAQAFADAMQNPPEMAHLLDLNDPRVDLIFKHKQLCKRCGEPVDQKNGQWHSNAATLSQYCWVDPQHGSQLHEI